jgi:hypothetical protein
MKTDKPIVTIDNERPKPATVEAVREAADDCVLDPRATPRSNQARLLFSLYNVVGLPFPYGWREASVEVLAERGVQSDALALDLLHTAMLTDAVADFEGWPGVDLALVRDLQRRLAPPSRTVARAARPPPAPPTLSPRRTNPFDDADVDLVVAAVGDGRSSRAVARAMASVGLTGRANLPLARAVCERLGIRVADGTLANKMTPSVD